MLGEYGHRFWVEKIDWSALPTRPDWLGNQPRSLSYTRGSCLQDHISARHPTPHPTHVPPQPYPTPTLPHPNPTPPQLYPTPPNPLNPTPTHPTPRHPTPPHPPYPTPPYPTPPHPTHSNPSLPQSYLDPTLPYPTAPNPTSPFSPLSHRRSKASASQNLSKDSGVEAELGKEGSEGGQVVAVEGVARDGGGEEAGDSEV